MPSVDLPIAYFVPSTPYMGSMPVSRCSAAWIPSKRDLSAANFFCTTTFLPSSRQAIDMSRVKDSFIHLERHHLRLEDNVSQLRKALQHWQTWDAEYEALKEEVEAAPDGSDELRHIHSEFEGELLHGREIDDIFGLQARRTKDQVANVLQRRIDYVSKNVESLHKQLEAAENKYAAAAVVSQPDATDADCQPITEIIEELDDNVVSYRLNRPGDSVPQVKEALAKAGIKDLLDGDPEPEPQTSEAPSMQESKPSRLQPKSAGRSEQAPFEPTSAKGTASFSGDTKPQDASPAAPPPEPSRRARRVERIMKTAREQESISKEKPVIPEDEDPEDAAMRQEMLKYSMGEVGAVVAELHLEEDDSEDEDFDDGDDEDEDDEDRYGRSRGRAVTDDYRQRMLELERRLGIKSCFTDAAGDEDSEADNEGIGRIVVKRGAETPPSASKPPPSKLSIKDKQSDTNKKSVRFAQSLDIAPDDKPAATAVEESKEPLVDPLSDIVERSGPSKAAEPKAPRKASRFKRARDETTSSGDIPKSPLDAPPQLADREPREPPTGPDGVTLADRLVEREPMSNPALPGEFDDALDRSAVASEYQRLRKRFIQRQGGFLKEDESPVQPLDEAEGVPERVSRFKAARLSRQ